MKILKHGNMANRIITCGNCMCEFEYGNEDIYVEMLSYTTYLVENYFTRCPECNAKIYIIPKPIKVE